MVQVSGSSSPAHVPLRWVGVEVGVVVVVGVDVGVVVVSTQVSHMTGQFVRANSPLKSLPSQSTFLKTTPHCAASGWPLQTPVRSVDDVVVEVVEDAVVEDAVVEEAVVDETVAVVRVPVVEVTVSVIEVSVPVVLVSVSVFDVLVAVSVTDVLVVLVVVSVTDVVVTVTWIQQNERKKERKNTHVHNETGRLGTNALGLHA